MKLASLSHGRDGRLVVVSRDLTRATDAFPVVATLQAALDDWERLAPRLADLAEGLEHGSVPSFRFHEHDCAAPLPRAFRRLKRGEAGSLGEVASDAALGAREPLLLRAEDGILCEAGIAVVTGDVPAGISRAEAFGCVDLLMLVARVGHRLEQEGKVVDAAATSFSPAAVEPAELGSAWADGAGSPPLRLLVNGAPAGQVAVALDFGSLIAEAAAARPLTAGTIIEIVQPLQAPFLRFGDTVRIEMKDGAGHSIFGAIEQEVLPHG